MAREGRAYVVRDAGSPSRMGKVYKVYPYTLKALLEAIDDARFRSYAEVQQLVVRVDGAKATADDHQAVRARKGSLQPGAVRQR